MNKECKQIKQHFCDIANLLTYIYLFLTEPREPKNENLALFANIQSFLNHFLMTADVIVCHFAPIPPPPHF